MQNIYKFDSAVLVDDAAKYIELTSFDKTADVFIF